VEAERRPGQVAHQQFNDGLPGIPGTPGNGNGERRGQQGSASNQQLASLAQEGIGQAFAQPLHSQEGSSVQLPAGVRPLQWSFLREAWLSGAYKKLKPTTALTIVEYFTTDKTYDDLAKEYGVSLEAVNQRIFSGIGKMRRILYKSNPQLPQEDPYPLAQIQKGKEPLEIARTEKSRQRRREAGKKGGGGRHVKKVDVFIEKTNLL